MALSTFEIPLQPYSQSFQINLAGTDYGLTVKWNDIAGIWIMDISDASSGASIAACIPVVPGSDLLSGLEYLGINGFLYVYTDGNPNALPTYDSMGVNSHLYFQTTVASG